MEAQPLLLSSPVPLSPAFSYTVKKLVPFMMSATKDFATSLYGPTSTQQQSQIVMILRAMVIIYRGNLNRLHNYGISAKKFARKCGN